MKILYVTTVSITMSFFPEHLKMLLRAGHTVELACNLSEPLRQDMVNMGLNAHHIPFSRSPVSPSNLKAYQQLKQLIRKGHYDIVHCHTPVAALCTRLACRKLRKQGLRVYYTAHGFHFYKGAPLLNWLIYYPVEKLCAHWTDVLITVNQEDYRLAQKKMKAKQVVYIPGVGIDLQKFGVSSANSQEKRVELGLSPDAKVLLSVGELNDNKNHETVIRAIASIPELTYLIAGNGVKEAQLQALIQELKLEERVRLLGYRTDVGDLYRAADAFAFPSFREGLSVALMEAMACGLPVVCSKIRGNVDLIDEKGGYVFNPHRVDDCRRAFVNLLQLEKTGLHHMGVYNRKKVKTFDTETVLAQLQKVYDS